MIDPSILPGLLEWTLIERDLARRLSAQLPSLAGASACPVRLHAKLSSERPTARKGNATLHIASHPHPSIHPSFLSVGIVHSFTRFLPVFLDIII
jgi:hypothetical protein